MSGLSWRRYPLLTSQHHSTDLIDGEADGVHILSLAAVAAAVFLHQGHQEAAGGLVVLRVVVLLQQANLILRVNPEGVCKSKASWDMESPHQTSASLEDGLTGMVPAAPRRAPSPPAPLKHGGVPEPGGVLVQSVRGQITDLQPGELTQELLEGHPEGQTDTPSSEGRQKRRPLRDVQNKTYQNSPSSILQSSSSFSAESMALHSEELGHTLISRLPLWRDKCPDCLKLTYHSRLRSTPPGPRGF